MSSPREKAKSLLYTYGIILLGSAILSFGLYNIHERTQVTEGGVLGMTLFLQHWLGLSPAITSPVMDIACYLLAWRFLGNSFARYAVTLGGIHTTLNHPVTSSHRHMPDENRRKMGITPGMFRLSVGIEDPGDLIRDFYQALEVFGE